MNTNTITRIENAWLWAYNMQREAGAEPVFDYPSMATHSQRLANYMKCQPPILYSRIAIPFLKVYNAAQDYLEEAIECPIVCTLPKYDFRVYVRPPSSTECPIIFVHEGVICVANILSSIYSHILPIEISELVKNGVDTSYLVKSIDMETRVKFNKFHNSYLFTGKCRPNLFTLVTRDDIKSEKKYEHAFQIGSEIQFLMFIIGHEYAHIILRNMEIKQNITTPDHLLEHQADALGAQLAMLYHASNGLNLPFIGILLAVQFLMLFDIKNSERDGFDNIGQYATHPSAAQRMAQVASCLTLRGTLEDLAPLVREIWLSLTHGALMRIKEMLDSGFRWDSSFMDYDELLDRI